MNRIIATQHVTLLLEHMRFEVSPVTVHRCWYSLAGCPHASVRFVTYHRDVKVVEFAPSGPRLRTDDIDLFELKRSRVPDVGQDGPGIGAQAAVLACEERDPASLEQSGGRPHRSSRLVVIRCA